ncbi:hypothetical protein [Micromonospora avicenniae]|uniref:hypothetical protein n=1 Tax=Micromonospora avicenniae TaxID=1198245 RepID=UPI003324D3CF
MVVGHGHHLVPDSPVRYRRYPDSGFTHNSDGRTLDRTGFAEMVAGIRSRVAEGTVIVLDELYDGSNYAERHRYRNAGQCSAPAFRPG